MSVLWAKSGDRIKVGEITLLVVSHLGFVPHTESQILRLKFPDGSLKNWLMTKPNSFVRSPIDRINDKPVGLESEFFS